MGNPIPIAKILGEKQEAYVYGNINTDKSLIFLCNADEKEAKQISFGKILWNLPRWSISILQGTNGSLNLLMNTAIIGSSKDSPGQLVFRKLPASVVDSKSFAWLSEPIPMSSDECDKKTKRPPPQVVTTQDTTDYMWLVTRLVIKDEKEKEKNHKFNLKLFNVGDVGTVYIDGKRQSMYQGGYQVDVPLDIEKKRDTSEETAITTGGNKKHVFTLQILNGLMGLPHIMTHMENYEQGILGDVYINEEDITYVGWGVNAGLIGEKKRYFDPTTHSAIPWKSMNAERTSPVTIDTSKIQHGGPMWYTFQFTLPEEYHDVTCTEDALPPIALDLMSMRKGNVWVNGRHLGRYWLELATRPTDLRAREDQDYAGWYDPHKKCRIGYDVPSQRYYHIPLEWIKRGGKDRKNCVVLFEEWTGDPCEIRIVQRVLCNKCESNEICVHGMA
ncbi:5802_t:CDS:1 [Acaulospora colombiana]|uniref:5802_t:CDS:1 n=1 Tax=Acaulospora colombiana TaxID=27376 RepID=A0ACA9NNQ9_9GLOM|nr:5802_t:CDS:1 [Acaulospora colombiana]